MGLLASVRGMLSKSGETKLTTEGEVRVDEKGFFRKWLLSGGLWLFVLGNVSGNVWMISLTDAPPELRFDDVSLLEGSLKFPHDPALKSNQEVTENLEGNYLLTLPFNQPCKLKFEAITDNFSKIEFDGGDDIATSWKIPVNTAPYRFWTDHGLDGINKLNITSLKMTVTSAAGGDPVIWLWNSTQKGIPYQPDEEIK
tara:strand:- start:25748 stop:26341 length:594 start_codon:yes stop_codon:yes gene_type:complete